MTIIPNTQRIPFRIDDLHPDMRSPIRAMLEATRAFKFTAVGLPSRFDAFEGYRSPVRQMHLLTVDKTTKAGPWKSAHQYGLAVDFAVRVMTPDAAREHWTWPERAPWEKLREIALSVGLDIPIKWDRGHVEHPIWQDLQIIHK